MKRNAVYIQKQSSGKNKVTRTVREWDEWLEDAQEYYAAFGNLLVSSRYETPDGYKLGRWIERQRAIYNGNPKIAGHLSLDQIKALNRIGMIWKLENRREWEVWLGLCDQYLKENGDLLVPKSYELKGAGLGNWINEQRKRYHKNVLTEDQIAELNKRKMVWSLGQRRAWEDWYEDAKEYYALHGDLLVPLSYITDEGELLGQWIFGQRYHRNSGKIYSEERIKQLDLIGMVWNLKTVRDDDWERMYVHVKAYKTEHGKLPLWPKGQRIPDGRTMDGWIATQRTRLSNNTVPDRQKEKLNEIGIYPFGYKKDPG